ncbi:MAG: hypothetical protein ABFD75_08305 [Smithella sp.]
MQPSGILFIGINSPNFAVMLIWLFIFSIGQHLFLPTNQSIGMELARDGKTGRRLGQLSGITHVSVIIGSFAVLIGFKFFNLNFSILYIID